ncbi:MAG TPA: molybdenum cofactor guanylyltransferase [Thermomicrobiales bacterium]|jgi:molybdopterin-guanine dinucleotide biosynthesis protein A|nr:molybdenum cofactor guanylyltransferase [Thermomicrobiales bacterium]
MIAGEETSETFSVAVLAGGMSRRMGVDKALLTLREGGPPLLQLVLERVRPLTDDCFVVAADRPAYAQFGVRVVPDARPGRGPLGGIATALAAARDEFVLVVACDMPLLSLPLLRFMGGVARDYEALVPALADASARGGKLTYQPLHAIYARRCLGPIERRLAAGQLAVIGLFDDVQTRVLDEATVRRFDPELKSFVNANTPVDVAAARLLLEAGAGTNAGRPASPILDRVKAVNRKDDHD